jgi:hypothetical protein
MSPAPNPSQTTTTRQAIANALKGYGSLPAKWVDGRLEPPVEHGDVGCTWIPSTREVSGKVYIEELQVICRVLSATQRSRGAKRALDPAKLERWRDDILLALSPGQTTLGGWYLRPTSSTIESRTGVVEVAIAVWQDNVFKTI